MADGGERWVPGPPESPGSDPGSSMTDGSPLVNIRKSLARVKAEVTAMDVRMGVVEHTLLQVWRGEGSLTRYHRPD